MRMIQRDRSFVLVPADIRLFRKTLVLSQPHLKARRKLERRCELETAPALAAPTCFLPSGKRSRTTGPETSDCHDTSQISGLANFGNDSALRPSISIADADSPSRGCKPKWRARM